MNEHSFYLRPLQLGLSLGTSLVVGYLACLALAIIGPDRSLHQVWLQFLYGFAWTPLGMLIGVVESFVYGLATGLVFAPIANFFGIARGG
jgi:2TM family of unknown function (DUF5676)